MDLKDSCYVIAEIGVNHNGDVALAKDLIDASAEAGADAVKFQTFFADELVTRSAAKAPYQKENTGKDESQHKMLKALELSEAEFLDLNDHCKAKDIAFLSTPFSQGAADLLERVGVNAFKISSGDLTYLQMLDHIGRKGRPIILSSGMGTVSEIEDAVRTIELTGNHQISILHCVSNYPASAEDCNLAAMDTIARAFGYAVGWSDHTTGGAITLAAVARGARIIEKHITLDCAMDGPDHAASMEPSDFNDLVRGIRDVERSIGNGRKGPTTAELDTAAVARRSLVAADDLPKGHFLVEEDIRILRPGTGLPPKQLPLLVGRTLAAPLAKGTPFELRHFSHANGSDD